MENIKIMNDRMISFCPFCGKKVTFFEDKGIMGLSCIECDIILTEDEKDEK